MSSVKRAVVTAASLPPYGGSGLKWKSSICLYRSFGLPPYGGSGLKFLNIANIILTLSSPSIRREWIEIHKRKDNADQHQVSLHTEGVD